MKTKQGCFLEALENGEVDAIAHGVNCQGGFGSGIAGQIAKIYPEVKESYLRQFDFGWGLGQVDGVKTDSGKYVFNCATQFEYGYDGKKYVNYGAVYECLKYVRNFCKNRDIKVLGLPRIGCGLAGGDWNVVKALIEEIFDGSMEVIIYEKK